MEIEKLLDEVYDFYESLHVQYMLYASGGKHMVESVRKGIGGFAMHNCQRLAKDLTFDNLLRVIELAGNRSFDDNPFHEGMSDCLSILEDKVKEVYKHGNGRNS